jgi:hypothetical protein
MCRLEERYTIAICPIKYKVFITEINVLFERNYHKKLKEDCPSQGDFLMRLEKYKNSDNKSFTSICPSILPTKAQKTLHLFKLLMTKYTLLTSQQELSFPGIWC